MAMVLCFSGLGGEGKREEGFKQVKAEYSDSGDSSMGFKQVVFVSVLPASDTEPYGSMKFLHIRLSISFQIVVVLVSNKMNN